MRFLLKFCKLVTSCDYKPVNFKVTRQKAVINAFHILIDHLNILNIKAGLTYYLDREDRVTDVHISKFREWDLSTV